MPYVRMLEVYSTNRGNIDAFDKVFAVHQNFTRKFFLTLNLSKICAMQYVNLVYVIEAVLIKGHIP